MDWSLDWTALRFLLDLVLVAGMCAVAYYTWWASRMNANKTAIKRVDERVHEVEGRVAEVERELNHMPTHADISELSSRIGDVHGDLREIKGSLKGLSRAVDLMNEHLIRQGDTTR